MPETPARPWIIKPTDRVLITGANGFIGARVVDCLLEYGFRNLCCFARPSGRMQRLEAVLAERGAKDVEVYRGNLLSREDCAEAARGAAVVIHLAAGVDKSFAGAFMNSVVTTRNLLDALVADGSLKRFVNVSSFAVYSNMQMRRGCASR